MKLFYSLIQILFILFFIGVNAVSRTNGPNPVIRDTCTGYFERITLYTDRTLYIAGEEIWFSTFLRCGDNSMNECLSRVLFVDLYRESNGTVIRQKLKITGGMANGSINIPSNFPTGNYFIRAYTNYQKNYLAEDLAMREILILNPDVPLSTNSDESKVSLYFRSGPPVYGLPAKGVMMSGKTGKNISGARLITTKNELVSPVEILNAGLGIFEFTPKPGENYILKILYNDGDSLVYPVRNISNSGWRIATRWKDGMLHINLEGVNITAIDKCKLIIKDRFLRTIWTDIVELSGNTIQYTLPARKFGSDRIYVILKDMQGELLAFTEVSKYKNELISLNLITDKSEYIPGEKVELTIDGLKDERNAGTKLSVSVILNGSSPSSEKDLLFHTREALTIIHENGVRQNPVSMIKLISEDTEPAVQNLPEIRDVSLSGMVVNSLTGEPLGNCRVYLSVLGPEPQLHIGETSDDGSFVFSLNSFTGQRKVFTGVDYRQHKDSKILIHNDFIGEYIPAYTTLSFTFDDHEIYEELYVNMQLAKRFGITGKTSKDVPFIAQPLFTHPDISILLADYIELSSMEEVFTEIVPYTYLKQRRDSFYFQMKNPDTEQIIDNPLVLLDNVPVFDSKAVLELSPASIERIDIIRQDYFLGSFRINGMINIISRETQLERIEFAGGTVFFDYQTISPGSKFGLQEELENCSTNSRIPCFSNVLYWNTGIILNDSPIKIEFYTAGNESEYKVVIKGETADGIPCYGETIVRVKRNN